MPVKTFCCYWVKKKTRKNPLYKCVGCTCMLLTNSPLTLFRPEEALGATLLPTKPPPPTPLPPSLPNRSSYDHETWRLFLKMFSGHFNVIVTCTSTFRLTLQPTFYSHVLQNLPFKNWIKFIFY